MASDSDYSGLIQFLVLVVIAIIALVIKGVKSLTGTGKESRTPAQPPSDRQASPVPPAEPPRNQSASAGGGSGGGPQTLEDFFRQLQNRRSESPPPTARPVPVARPVQPRQASKAVPVARPVASPGSRTVPAPAVENRFTAAAIAKAKASIASSRTGQKIRLRRVKVGPEGEQGAVPTPASLGKLDRAGLARAVLLAEILGKPRAIEAYSGPPQAG